VTRPYMTVGLLVLVAISACHDTSAPIAPFYVLVAVDGHSLPVVYNGIDVSSTLLSGTLRPRPEWTRYQDRSLPRLFRKWRWDDIRERPTAERSLHDRE
jgi:hypothetical protein